MAKAKPAPTAPEEHRADRDLFDDPDLIEFTSRLPEARKVSIKVMNPDSGNWRHKGSLAIDSFNLDAVQKRYGGGTYQFSIHGADGRLLKTISNIEIDDVDDDEREPELPRPAAAVAAVSEIQLLREQMAQDRLLMMEMLRGMGKQQPAPQSDITQLVAALSTLKAMEPKHEQPPAVQDLIMKSFTAGIDIAAKLNKTGGSDGSPLGEILGFVREVFQDARPIIQAAIANAAPQLNVVPGATKSSPEGDPDEMDESEIDLKPALTFVRTQLESGIPPKSLADLVLLQMSRDAELNETLSALIADEPIEGFLELAPELKAEPLRTKFGEFFGVVRARIFADRDSRGNSGDAAHAGGHAGADAQGR
jgi:hypothetical protein